MQRDQRHYKVSLNHVLGDLLTEGDDLLLREVLGDLVVEAEVQKDLTGACPSDAMDVLQRALHPLVVRNLNTTDTDALDPQATVANASLL